MKDSYSMKDLDQALKQPKGTGFRLFKASLPRLQENEDFRLLNAKEDASVIRQLRTEGRIYAQSVNVVMLSRRGYRKLLEYWEKQSP